MLKKTFKTKLSANATESVQTEAVIDFEGVTQEELEALAAATVVINQQALYRTAGVIPKSDTISVRKQLDSPKGGGFKPTPEALSARINKMTAADYRATLEQLGLPEAQVDKMVSKKFPS